LASLKKTRRFASKEIHMSDPEIPRSLLKQNPVDKVADSTIETIDAAKTSTVCAFDSAIDRVEAVRSSLSPAFDSALESVMKYTRDEPLKALFAAAASGALVALIFRPRR
jgi:hypothetical protein